MTTRRSLSILVLTRTTSFHNRGGFEDHIDTLYRGLAQKGHRIHILTTAHPDHPETTSLEADGVTVHFVLGSTPGRYSRVWWKESPHYIARLLSDYDFDLIHSQSMAVDGLFRSAVFKQISLPVIISYHGTNYDEFCSLDNIFKYMMRFKYLERVDNFCRFLFQKHTVDRRCHLLADRIIATSNEQADIFRRVYKVSESKVRLVYNGMSVDDFYPQQKDADLLAQYALGSGPVVLGLARFARSKGFTFLISAFPAVLAQFPDAKLLLVGDGPMMAKLKALVAKLGLGKSVVFTGMVPFSDLAKYFNVCDIFVNPTIRQNGYDLTMIEAMACERPVLATHIGSHPTLIKDGENGVLVPKADVGALSEAIIKMLRSPEQLKAMGQNGRQDVLSQFSDTQMIDKMDAVYDELVSQ